MKTTKIAKQMVIGLDFSIRYDVLDGRKSIKKTLESQDPGAERAARAIANAQYARIQGYTECMNEADIIDRDEMEAINRQCQHLIRVQD